MNVGKCEPLRLIGMALTDLTTDDFRQISLFENPDEREKQKKADEAFDDIRRRFGNGMIVRGSTVEHGREGCEKGESSDGSGRADKEEKRKIGNSLLANFRRCAIISRTKNRGARWRAERK